MVVRSKDFILYFFHPSNFPPSKSPHPKLFFQGRHCLHAFPFPTGHQQLHQLVHLLLEGQEILQHSSQNIEVSFSWQPNNNGHRRGAVSYSHNANTTRINSRISTALNTRTWALYLEIVLHSRRETGCRERGRWQLQGPLGWKKLPNLLVTMAGTSLLK